MKWAALKGLREVGILLLTVSLLFLPWYLDPSPEGDQSPFVAGVEFITGGSWSVMMVYALTLLAYIISRFSSHKWASFIPLWAAGLLYLCVHCYMTAYFVAPGVYLDRTISSMDSMIGARALVGIPVNCAGLLALAAGLYAASWEVL